jgi:hypothetical protein
MAKTFDPSKLSAGDQAAFSQWQQRLQAYVAQNGGGIPAPVSYALAHPEYLGQHPELQRDYELVSGAMLPSTAREQLRDYNPAWGNARGEGGVGMQKKSGLFDKWETWLQLGLGAAVAAPVALPALGVGGAAGGSSAAAGGAAAGASAVPALEGGATLAANLGGAGALGAGGAAAGTAGAASTASQFWDKVLGKSKADKILTGVGLAGNLAGKLYQGHQIDKATQAQIDAANKALELQKQVYGQQRADLAPYRNIGSGAVNLLTLGMGITPGADTTTPYFQQQAQQNTAAAAPPPQRSTTPTPGQAVPRDASLSTLSQQPGLVNMVSPDGRPARVPQNQVQAAIQAGGRMA